MYLCNVYKVEFDNMSEEIKDITKPIEETEVLVEDINYKDLYIRLLADHDNYVKRTNKTLSETTRNAQSKIMEDIMIIYNDLCCAVEQKVDGAHLLRNKMESVIQKLNYDIIDSEFIVNNLDGYFDTDYCEAISTIPCSDEYIGNMVAFVAKIGLYDKIKKQTVIHAQCVVAN